ncbi:hypothetical protein BDV98DRAFT_176684 [Pterulicium gracile]|uniref:Uncharacterized protein n=1 Tax=Pterulicium gracile TaxID=1884261 RepID=A0A5C3QDZ2_9AGAR|nr:hypothetical protein BDV98DRAFT_176684 [Pterula gracilis]
MNTDAVEALSELLPRFSSLQTLDIISRKRYVKFDSILSTLQWLPPDVKGQRSSTESPEFPQVRTVCPGLEDVSLQDFTIDSHSPQNVVQIMVYNKQKDPPATSEGTPQLSTTGTSPEGGHLQWARDLWERRVSHQS